MSVIVDGREFQSVVRNIAVLASADAIGAFNVALGLSTPGNTYGVIRETVPAILSTYGSVTGTVSSTYYENQRIKAKVPGSFVPVLPDVDWTDVSGGTVGYTISRLRTGAPLDATRAIMAQNIYSNLFDYSRQVVSTNAEADGGRTTYRRLTSPKACDFCLYVAISLDPGRTNKIEKQYHSKCSCVDIPVFQGQSFDEPAYYEKYREDLGAARAELENAQSVAREQDPGLRRKAFFAKYPDTAITTSNLVKKVREVRLGEQ
jgi:hypothetical protein